MRERERERESEAAEVRGFVCVCLFAINFCCAALTGSLAPMVFKTGVSLVVS